MAGLISELAAANGDGIALRDERRALTWREVDNALDRIANGLRGLDLADERRVAVFAENGVEVVLANFGGLIAGKSVVPVSFHLTADEAAYILADSGTSVVFVDDATAERGLAAARQAGCGTVIGWRVGTEGVRDFDDWLAAQAGRPAREDLRPRPPLLYTSGTTGRPKGVELPPQMFGGGESVSEHFERLREHAFVPFGPHLVVCPMYHTGPLNGVRALAAGVPLVILGRFDAEKTLRTIERYRVGSTTMVPTQFFRLLALSEAVRKRHDVSSLKRVNHTGSRCPVEVKQAMIVWWGPVFAETYGSTEAGAMCRISSEEWLANPGSVGRAMPPYEVVILDEGDRPVAPGTAGRIFFRDATGRGIVYHGDPEKTAAAHVAPGVFTLGDIGYINEAGYVFITDRATDMVISGGVNIYPAEAEQVLIGHPAVQDVACIGVPDSEMGEALKALVVPRDRTAASAPQDLIDWCRERLSHYKCPSSLDYVDDLERNAMGKLDKRKLRERALRRQDRDFRHNGLTI